MENSLGNRMKRYERVYLFSLPENLPVILRIDGKNFHEWTRKMKMVKPFDERMTNMMDFIAIGLCSEIPNARLVYIQSDEISILLQKKNIRAQTWFNNEIQKMVSISASLSASLAAKWLSMNSNIVAIEKNSFPCFDSRVFILPESEVENYFIFRQNDWSRNSVQMLARSLYSHKELEGKNQSEMHELIHQKSQNWNDLPTYLRRGRCAKREDIEISGVVRHVWKIDEEIPIFSADRDYIRKHLVTTEEEKS